MRLGNEPPRGRGGRRSLRRSPADGGRSILPQAALIEERGAHLPLGTDVYLPYAALNLTRQLLGPAGLAAIILASETKKGLTHGEIPEPVTP